MSLWTENYWGCLYERAGLCLGMIAKPTFFTFYYKSRLQVLVHFYQTTRRHIPEDDDLLTQHHRSLNSAPFMIIVPLETTIRYFLIFYN
jgi:hypothetical protein